MTYYVVYRSKQPGSKPNLATTHRTQQGAKKSVKTHLADPYWRVYDWSVTTEKPAAVICLSN